MKKQYKNIFGLFGLSVVAFTTVFAANLPASAASIGCTPSTTTEEGGYTYDSVECDLTKYGYGEYTLRVTADGPAGPAENSVHFWYLPISISIERDEDDAENPIVHIDHSEDVKYATIEVLDKDGNPIFDTITVNPITRDVVLPFFENKIKSGTYTIRITAYDINGNVIYQPYQKTLEDWNSIHIPDTGSLFQNLNISRTDYLITGLVVFTIAAIFGLIFTIKNRKNRINSKHRH